MKEGLNFSGVKKSLKLKFEKSKESVRIESQRLQNGAKAPYVSENCPEKYRDIAERLVAIQSLSGEIKPEDISRSDVNKIKEMTKLEPHLSFKENISLMVANAYYVDFSVINARHILRFLNEFAEIYEKFYIESGVIPLNAFSTETRIFIKNLKSGLSKEDVMRLLLEVYLPEHAHIEMEHHNYKLVPRQALTEDDIKRINSELSSIAVDKNINEIFSPKYETYLKKLCERLKLAGYTFDQYISKYTDFDYTMCFKADIVKAVRQMCLSFHSRNNTTVGIQIKDPYLYSKIDLAKEIVGVYSIGEFLDRLGVQYDNYDTTKHILSEEEIAKRESLVFSKLETLFPERHIPLEFSLHDKKIYDEILFLARRRKFSDINDYLSAKGFTRDLNYNAKTNRCMYLSERDVVHYDFLKGCKNPEDVEVWLREKGLEIADPYVSLGVYRKLAFKGMDSEYKAYQEKVSQEKQ